MGLKIRWRRAGGSQPRGGGGFEKGTPATAVAVGGTPQATPVQGLEKGNQSPDADNQSPDADNQ